MARPSPTAAAQVAAALRERIVDGRLPDGAELPRQEDLLRTFGVSHPTLRAALRILETEGLITVRRGAVGGAVVHAPNIDSVTHSIGLLLQSEQTMLSDVASCLDHLEPICAGLCAARPDRATTVVPILEELNETAIAAIDDVVAFTTATRQFHLGIARNCGIRTMAVFAEAVETLWFEQTLRWAVLPTSPDDISMEQRHRSNQQHVDLTEAIRAGDVELAQRLAQHHMAETVEFWVDHDRSITATDQVRPFGL